MENTAPNLNDPKVKKMLKASFKNTQKDISRSETIKEFWQSFGHNFKISRMPDWVGRGWTIRTFEIREKSVDYLRAMFQGRYCEPGLYTALELKGAGVMMSDTPAEIFDHREVYAKAKETKAKSALINGLGLGVVVKMLLTLDHIERIDVVELSNELIAHVGPTITDERVVIHHADAFLKRWPKDASWDIAWHDIWISICGDNLPAMKKLRRKYAKKVRWQGCWSHEEIMRKDRQDRSWKRCRKET